MVTTPTTPKEPAQGNVRHDLAADRVKAAIDKKIAQFEQRRLEWKHQAQEALERYQQDQLEGRGGRWSRPPDGPGYVDALIDDWIERERHHYARVRVIERPEGPKRFVLVYGLAPDAEVAGGTGPFRTLDEAASWFLNGGR